MNKYLNNFNSRAFKVSKAPTLDRDVPATVSPLRLLRRRLLLQILTPPLRFVSMKCLPRIAGPVPSASPAPAKLHHPQVPFARYWPSPGHAEYHISTVRH